MESAFFQGNDFLERCAYILEQKEGKSTLRVACLCTSQNRKNETFEESEYTKEQVTGLIEQSQKQENEKFLERLKELISNGESTISMLRYFYPSDIVIADSKQ